MFSCMSVASNFSLRLAIFRANISETVILVAMATLFAAYYLYRETDFAMSNNSTSIFTEIGPITLLPVARMRHSRPRTGL